MSHLICYFCCVASLKIKVLKVTFLGTGTSQGVPIIACKCEVCASTDSHDKRLRSSAMVEVDGHTILIDAGPDFRQQMLRAKVTDLDAILITHEHKDHVAGLDDVRAFNYILNRPMDIFGEQRVLDHLKVEFSYVFSENPYPGVPQMRLHPIDGRPFAINGIEVIPVRVKHYKLPIYGFRMGDFSYITDANFISEQEKRKLYNSKVLVVNALRREEHISHFTLSKAIDLIAELKPEVAYLTHISHQMGKHSDISKELPANVHLAYDGLAIEL